MKEYDIIIIGGGGGTKFVTPAVALGLKVAIVEKEDLGGTCLNRGCIPSKMLIHPANVLTEARDMAKYAIEHSGDFTVDWKALVDRVSSEVDAESTKIATSYTKSEAIDYYHATATFKSDKVLVVDGGEITAEVICIATGSRPSIPPIPGLEGTPYMTSREALTREDLPKDLIIIGGGYIGVELGHVYSTFGSQTTFFVRSTFLGNEDETISEIFQSHMNKNFTVHYGTQELNVSYDNGIFTVSGKGPDGKEVSQSSEALLVATGVVPNTDELGLENTDIKTNKKGYITVNDYLQTDVADVYALGDCVGNYMFRHSVNFEAEFLVDNLFERDPQDMQKISYPPMPHAVFTAPEIAGVGKTEQELKSNGANYLAVTHEYVSSAQGMARIPEVGLVKLLIDKDSQRLLGAHIIGQEAATMIHQLILAATMKATVKDLLKMIYIHPALPEIVRNALRKADKELNS